jgi:hypothetical protein
VKLLLFFAAASALFATIIFFDLFGAGSIHHPFGWLAFAVFLFCLDGALGDGFSFNRLRRTP